MPQATVSFRVDPTLKTRFDSLCEAFGLNATSAFSIFMKTVVRERRIPFEIRADSADLTRQEALNAFEALRQQRADSGMPPMSLEEINAEIKATRNERREKGLRSH